MDTFYQVSLVYTTYVLITMPVQFLFSLVRYNVNLMFSVYPDHSLVSNVKLNRFFAHVQYFCVHYAFVFAAYELLKYFNIL